MYQPFSRLHWHLPCCKYIAVTHINTKNEDEIKVWLKRNCVWFEKHIACAIAQIKLFKHWTHSLFPLKTWKSQPIVWLSVWKFECLKCLKQILGWVFWSWGNIKTFLKIWSVKSIYTRFYTYNKNLELLAEFNISTLYFEIFYLA